MKKCIKQYRLVNFLNIFVISKKKGKCYKYDNVFKYTILLTVIMIEEGKNC